MEIEQHIESKDFALTELNGLPNSFFTKNRMNFLKNLDAMLSGLEKDSILVLQGGEEIPRYDTDVVDYHFQQEGNFYYLTGVTDPQFYAIIDNKDGGFNLFYALTTDEREKTFRTIPSLKELSKKYATKVYNLDDLFTEIKKRDPKKIYVLNGTNSDSGRKIPPAKLIFPTGFEDLEIRVDANPYIYEILADSRTRKTKEEVNLLKYVAKMTIEAHLEAFKVVMPDVYERDVENAFFNYLRTNYYVRIWAYNMICGCGVDSATLHYTDNDKKLKNGDLMLLDMGVRFGGYVSDVTSTIPVSGKFTKEQAEIYNIVLKANRAVIEKIGPGVYWPDLQIVAEKVIINGLIDLKLLNNFDLDDMIKDRVAYYFMPHGLGHFLGIDVHDVGGYLSFTPKRIDEPGLRSLRTARYLAVNNIITVEPGVYFIPFLLEKAFNDEKLKGYFTEKVKQYYNFGGIRIEDDILVTTYGCENLTAGLPREVHQIENLMKDNLEIIQK